MRYNCVIVASTTASYSVTFVSTRMESGALLLTSANTLFVSGHFKGTASFGSYATHPSTSTEAFFVAQATLTLSSATFTGLFYYSFSNSYATVFAV